ncbi:MAG: hypothetical protein QOG15_641 [Solirubrobacteraceae bacterium]|jgi:hypothetical protein|nr:hypothetical protein [Solirubrobacteraceae bacterium]
MHARNTFEPSDGGTLARFAAQGRLSGALRLAEPLLQRTLKRQFAKRCTTLKHVLEDAA